MTIRTLVGVSAVTAAIVAGMTAPAAQQPASTAQQPASTAQQPASTAQQPASTAQQQAPCSITAPTPGTQAPPPVSWAAPPLADGPIMVQSAEPAHRNLRLRVTKGLSHPWAMAFLPDGAILITERAGRVRIVRDGKLDPNPVAGVPVVGATGLSGLLDIALHPRFAENRFVYLTYHKPVPPQYTAEAMRANVQQGAAPAPGRGGRGPAPLLQLVLARGTWDGKALVGVTDIFNTCQPGSASRIVFGRDGMIYMSSGNASEIPDPPPQDPNDYRGKLLRLRDDGTVPADNPFVGRAGHKPEIYSMGHRNQLGMAVNPETGELWASEQGPNGGDEINIIRAGKNYGWPLVSYGRSYMGGRIGTKPIEGLEEPIVVWIPSIALSGMTFYTGDVFPAWKRNVFVGGLRQGEIPRTGQIQRIVFNEKWEEIRREPMLRELQQRIRDVRQGPDGYLYVLTEEDAAALIRIEPGEAPAPAGAVR
jgi:glucose/arabinose dehydrogenase